MKFTKYKLGEIATIEISGVDKKTINGEIPVRLCNFVDVYRNWAITRNLYDDLMLATVKQRELDKFLLKKGQIAITKDSETKDDIGIPTYIADDFSDVVLGYHCVLITPYQEFLDGHYLNAFLHTKYIQTYFENNASGSGQRYTLSIDAINEIPVFLPLLDEQKRIGKLFTSIDRKIELNSAINHNLEAMAKQLYDYWFVQFDFPDDNGKPYKSSGGKMVWNEKLKRKIPEGWKFADITKLTSVSKETLTPSDVPNKLYKHYSLPEFDKSGTYAMELGSTIQSDKFIVDEDSILVSKLNPWTNRVLWGLNLENQICSTEFIVWQPKSIKLKGFLYMLAKCDNFIKYCTQGATGTSHSHRRISPDIVMKYQFPYDESIMYGFSDFIVSIMTLRMEYLTNINKLTKLRDELLPLLMNGQASVNYDLSHG